MKVLLSHSGKQHSYHVAKAMYDLGILEKFITSSYIRNQSIQEYFTKRNNTYWTRRFHSELPGNYVESNWRFEIPEIVYNRVFGKGRRTSNAVYQRDERFDKYLSKKISKYSNNFYWGFQGSSLLTLKEAKIHNIPTIVELSTAHVTAAKKILGEEVRLHPEWADSMDNLIFPKDYEQRLVEEPEVADFIIAASSFTKMSLIDSGILEDKIYTLPLGFDIEKIDFVPSLPRKGRKLKVLYSGTITQRKGIKYLLEAVKHLTPNEVELTLIGNIQGSGNALKAYSGLFKHIPGLSQAEMFNRYGDYDVLVLPTIFEGFGLVILEALACGLPVITTPHSIGPEIIKDGQNGFIVPIRDENAVAKAIVSLMEKEDDELMEMRKKSRDSALSYSWEQYKNRLNSLYLTLEQKIGE